MLPMSWLISPTERAIGGEVGFAGEQGVLEAQVDEAADDLADGHVGGVEVAAVLVDEAE